MSKKMICTNCGFGDHRHNAKFCVRCGEVLGEKNICLNEDYCRNNKIEYCDINKDDKYCYLCGSLTTVGKFEEMRHD
jgi:hypothetical protein